MKKILVCLSVLLGCASLTSATENTNSNWTPSVTLRSVIASEYLMFSTGSILYDKPVIQTDLFVIFRNGFYFDLWNSAPFEGYDHNLGTEQDLGIGWAGPLFVFGINGKASDMILDIGIAYFNEPKLLTLGADDVLYSHVKLSKEFKLATISGQFENYASMPGSFYPGGNLFSIGFNKGRSFFKDRVSASTSLALAYGTDMFGLDSGFFLRGSVELDWKLTKRLTMILPQVNYYAPLTVHDNRSLDAVVFSGFSYQF